MKEIVTITISYEVESDDPYASDEQNDKIGRDAEELVAAFEEAIAKKGYSLNDSDWDIEEA